MTQPKIVCIVGLGVTRNDWIVDTQWMGKDGQANEIWGLNQGNFAFDIPWLSKFTRWFQIHPWDGMIARYMNPNYLEWLYQTHLPVYLHEPRPEVPTGIRYPFEEVEADLGTNYFATNTLGYMIALAIHEDFEEIRVYGVNMGDNDLGDFYARPSIEFLLGLAKGRGIKVWVPEESALLKGNLYAQMPPVPPQDLYTAVNGMRALLERMPFGYPRTYMMQVALDLERIYLDSVKDKARVVPIKEKSELEMWWPILPPRVRE